jgi:hypothetical protein
MPLSQEYISDRSLRIHTDESFAKAIQEAALEAAAEALQSPTKDVINIDDVSIEISQAEFSTMAGVDTCIRLCVRIFGRRICRHVGVNVNL